MVKAIAFSLLMALGVLSFVRPAHPTSFQSYISFKGSKQGQLKGESTSKGREKDGWFHVVSFDMGAELPVDANKGGSTGQRTHKPMVITKETDGSSPQLLQAHSTNEVFETIVIQTLDDQNKISKTITLTNAVISDLRKSGTTETISFGYEKVETK